MQEKVNARNKWSLSIGCIGRDMCYTLVSLFLLTYLQYTGLFNTSQFVVLTIIIVICHVWDAVNDPMMGTIITNTKTKFGKYRPWVLIGAITNSIVMVLLFTVRFANGWANVAFIGTMYLLWGMTFTMNDISYWDLLPALASEKKERDGLTTLVAVFASVGAFASGGIVPIVTPGHMVEAYRIVAIVCALVFLACQILVFFGVHDNKDDSFIEKTSEEVISKEETVTLKGMVKILVGNKQLMVMAVVILLYSLGSALLNAFGQNFFYFKFGYLSKDGGMSGGTMMTIFTVIYALGTLVSQAIYPMLANKWNRNQLITGSIIALVIGYVGFFLMANILDASMVSFLILCVFGVFIFVGQGLFYLVMLVMLTNTIEYGEWQTGKNHAAITFTIRPFMVKLASAIQYGVVALTLIACGLYAITSDVGVFEVAIGMVGEGASRADIMTYLADNGKNIVLVTNDLASELRTYASDLFVASKAQMLGLTSVMTAVPVVLFVVAYVVCKKYYIIDEAMYEKITKEIAERKNQ